MSVLKELDLVIIEHQNIVTGQIYLKDIAQELRLMRKESEGIYARLN